MLKKILLVVIVFFFILGLGDSSALSGSGDCLEKVNHNNTATG